MILEGRGETREAISCLCDSQVMKKAQQHPVWLKQLNCNFKQLGSANREANSERAQTGLDERLCFVCSWCQEKIAKKTLTPTERQPGQKVMICITSFDETAGRNEIEKTETGCKNAGGPQRCFKN